MISFLIFWVRFRFSKKVLNSQFVKTSSFFGSVSGFQKKSHISVCWSVSPFFRSVSSFFWVVYYRRFTIFSPFLLNIFFTRFSKSSFKKDQFFNIELALFLNKYAPYKRLKGLKWSIQKFSTILYSQFNYHTLPVTPFKLFCCYHNFSH